MKCLRCGKTTEVTTTYQNENGITRRRRQCTACGFRFTTRENPDPRDVERAKLADTVKKPKKVGGEDLQRVWSKNLG